VDRRQGVDRLVHRRAGVIGLRDNDRIQSGGRFDGSATYSATGA
jgi:hypothetical protein